MFYKVAIGTQETEIEFKESLFTTADVTFKAVLEISYTAFDNWVMWGSEGQDDAAANITFNSQHGANSWHTHCVFKLWPTHSFVSKWGTHTSQSKYDPECQ